MLCIIAAAAFIFYKYSNEETYDESVSQLNELSTQLIEKTEVHLDKQWDFVQKFALCCEEKDDMTEDQLVQLINECTDMLSPVGKTVYFRAITDDGRYYTKDGKLGIWTGLDQLDTEADRQSFLIANWNDEQNYMAFVIKAQEQITVGKSLITHYAVLRSMEDMGPYFHSSVFGENNVLYLVDQEGNILFEDGKVDMDFEGTDLFHSLSLQYFPHYESFDAALAEVKNTDRVCTDMQIGEEKYYLVYDQMPEYTWGIVLLVPEENVAVTTAGMVRSIFKIFLVLMTIFFCALLVLFVLLSHFMYNKRLLDIKISSERQLEETNELLENYNRELESSKKVAEQALQEATRATKAKSNFLSNMSHDIRTPMNAIVGVTKLMENDIDDKDKMHYYIKKLEQSGNYMLGLINDILDMSKIESGEVKLNVEPVKMAEQAGQIESIIRAQSNEKNQEFIFTVREIVHEYLIGDSIRIRQIFINLLNNAVKYTPRGGDISFEIGEIECDIPGYARFVTSVKDNGHGMSAEFMKHMFEPFTREENSVTNKIQGTGLGMSITKSLVDLMGGSIAVESKVEGGSRFDVTLTLPIDTENEHDVGVKSILLVSDEQMLDDNIRASLRETDINIQTATSYSSAVQMLKGTAYDVVLLSGYSKNEELTEVIKGLRAASCSEILIFCCDYSHTKYIRKVLAGSGIDGFISRPFFRENLILAIANARANESKDQDRKSPLGGMRFLCAEDNELNAEILEALLAMHGATCVIYPTGVEIVKAFESVKKGDFDAILMDVQMPKMDGLSATRAIRSGDNPLGADIPIIAMTANAFSSDVQECLEAGMDAHIAKPIDLSVLERTLHDILSKNSGGGISAPSKSRWQQAEHRERSASEHDV